MNQGVYQKNGVKKWAILGWGECEVEKSPILSSVHLGLSPF
jgi:hypothetical protein